MDQSLEKAPLGQLMAKFCLPCITSLLVSCLYNIVDQMFVGNGIGYQANAATGVIFPLTVLGWGLSLLFGDGAAAAFSLSQGSGQKENAARFCGQAVWMTFVSSLIVAVLFLLFPSAVLRFAGASDALMAPAYEYGCIILLFMPLAMVQNAMAPMIRADGAPAYSMLAMIAGALFNIAGDYIAIFVLHMGLAGAAWATVLGQVLSLLICLAYFLKGPQKRLTLSLFQANWQLDFRIARLGMPSFLSQISIVAITIVNNLLLVHFGALSQYGSEIPLAAFVVLMKLFQIVINIAIGIGAGCQPIVGTNFAAGNVSRVRGLFGRMCIWTALTGIAASVCFFLFAQPIVEMFGAQDALYLQFAIRTVHIYLSLIMLTCLQKMGSIFMQAAGQASQAAFLSILRDGLLVIFAVLFANLWKLEGIFWSSVAADLVAGLWTGIVLIRFIQTLPERMAKAASTQNQTISQTV